MDIQTDIARAREGNEPHLGVLHQAVAEGGAGTRAEIDHARRHAGFFERLEELGRDGGRIARRLQHHGIAAHRRGRRHAGCNGAGEIPGRDHRADAERDVTQVIAFAGRLHHRLGLGQDQSLAGVKFQEVDGLAGIGLGFIVILAHFQNQPGIELQLAPAQNVRGPEQQAGAFFPARVLPRLERRERSLHRRLDVFLACLLVHADHLGGIRRIHRANLLRRAAAFPADHQVILAAKFEADFINRRAHRPRVLRVAKVHQRFVGER